MAQVKYEEQPSVRQTTTQTGPGFLSLANDGDEAVVRIMVDSVADFDIVTMHQIEAGGKFRKVSCLRGSDYEPLENCPLCAAGVRMQQRIYIPVIEYKKDEAGNIIPVPEIWERSRKEADRLNGFLNNYGPLSAFISKIIRHGKHGDRATTYDIVPNLDKRIYSDAVYPIVNGAFDNFHALGRVVQERTAEDLQYYLTNGDLPAKNREANAQPAYEDVKPQYGTFVPPETAFSGVAQNPQATYPTQTYVNPELQQIPPQFVPQSAAPNPQAAYAPQQAYEPQTANTVQRPKRYY